jgi:putative phosphoribosyl transferase
MESSSVPPVKQREVITMSTNALVKIDTRDAEIEGMLVLPPSARGIVLFAHGSGSGRNSPRNNAVAGVLRAAGLGTLLLDLLTPDEENLVVNRFDIALLASRLRCAALWLAHQPATRHLPLGLFGASTGAAAALQVAAERDVRAAAIVSRGGRPELAGAEYLRAVTAPTLLIVGGEDDGVIALNRRAYDLLGCTKELAIVPGATHLFEEPGALEEVARLAADWFTTYCAAGGVG